MNPNDNFNYFDLSLFPEDDDDDFQPDENSNDDDEDINVDAPNDTQHQQPTFDLQAVLLRFNTLTPFPPNQLLISSFPKKNDLPNSPFTVDQWDLLRHQCGIHFFLLCRSVRFTTFCASSDAIVTGLLALMHTFNQIFKSSVEMTKNLNDLYGEQVFVPVLGDPKKSRIPRADKIIDLILKGKQVDDLLELDFFNEIFNAYPTKGITKPIYIECHSPWTKEEDALLNVAHRRFSTPQDIQKYVMPGRSIQVITQHMKDDWRANEHPTMLPPKKRADTRYNQRNQKEKETSEDEEEDDDDAIFEVSETMRFNDSSLSKIPSNPAFK